MLLLDIGSVTVSLVKHAMSSTCTPLRGWSKGDLSVFQGSFEETVCVNLSPQTVCLYIRMSIGNLHGNNGYVRKPDNTQNPMLRLMTFHVIVCLNHMSR